MVTDDDADLETLENTLQSIEAVIEVKAHNSAALVKQLDASADMIDAEIKRLQQRKKAIENRVQSIKNYLHIQLEVAGIDKVKTPAFTVALQNNPPAVQINDPNIIPSNYITIIPEQYVPDKKRIAEALKNGASVPGTELTVGRSLRIR
jgi:hypothetical protein